MTPKERAAMQQALEAIGNTVNQALATIREALAEPQITTPDVCGEVCARAKLCYGCNKDLEEANAKYAEQAEQEPVAFADKYGNVMKAKEKLTSTNVRDNWYDRPLYEKAAFDADLYSVAGKLALELECLLLDTKDLSVVSKWWDSAHEALEQWRSFHSAPVQPLKQEPVAWHEPGSYGNVTTHKIWAMKNGWLPLYQKEQE